MRFFSIARMGVALAFPCFAFAEDFTIHAFVKPEGQVAHVLVRVPLAALNRAELPLQTTNGELDIARANTVLPNVARWWIAENFELYADGNRVTTPRVMRAMVTLASDNSFTSYQSAWTHLMGTGLEPDTRVIADQTVLDVLLDYPLRPERARLAVHPMLARLGARVTTEIQLASPDDPNGGAARTFEVRGDPGLFSLDPGVGEVLRRFVPLGFKSVLTDTASLLLLFSAVLLMRRIARLVPFVGAFAFAAIVTFVASAYGLAPDALWLMPLVSALTSLAILYLAFENIAGGVMPEQRRWILGLAAGFAYGFSFEIAFQPTYQFSGSHALAAIACFLLGLLLAEAVALAIFLPVVSVLVRFDSRKRMGTIVAGALIADAAWHRFSESMSQIGQFNLKWPTWDAALVSTLLTWLAIFSLATGAAFVAFGLWNRHDSGEESAASQPFESNRSDEAATLRN